jgi:phospholipase/carboxylesterase
MERDERLSVIALHGLAASHDEIDAAVAPVMAQLGSLGARIVFPRAKRRPVTILGGEPALAWYDILAYDRSRMDEQGIEEAASAVCETVKAERERGGFRHRVALVGFSQGGALALHAGLRARSNVDGIVVVAAALPLPEAVPPATKRSPPVFLGHGVFDGLVPYALGRETERLLSSRGYRTTWRSYACGHRVTRRQMSDVSSWLRRNVLDTSAPSVASYRPLGRRGVFPPEAWTSR